MGPSVTQDMAICTGSVQPITQLLILMINIDQVRETWHFFHYVLEPEEESVWILWRFVDIFAASVRDRCLSL